MRIDEAVEVDRALRFWQERALAYEQALRKIDYVCGDAEWAEAIARITRAALDKPDQM